MKEQPILYRHPAGSTKLIKWNLTEIYLLHMYKIACSSWVTITKSKSCHHSWQTDQWSCVTGSTLTEKPPHYLVCSFSRWMFHSCIVTRTTITYTWKMQCIKTNYHSVWKAFSYIWDPLFRPIFKWHMWCIFCSFALNTYYVQFDGIQKLRPGEVLRLILWIWRKTT
jgi:hypothetical protein